MKKTKQINHIVCIQREKQPGRISTTPNLQRRGADLERNTTIPSRNLDAAPQHVPLQTLNRRWHKEDQRRLGGELKFGPSVGKS